MEEFIWANKYRPRKVSDLILPEQIKAIFQQFVDQKNVPNLLLSGPAGVGKTSAAKAILEQLGCDYIMINSSMYGNIDTLRNEILTFASTVSFSGGRKYVILDEADGLNVNSTQPALKSFMVEFADNCGFILTCNYKNKIIPEIHSRCSEIEFKIPKKDRAKIASQYLNKAEEILALEKVKYDRLVIAEIISKYFPDFRRVLNELQKYSASGKIDTGIFADNQELSIKEVIDLMKLKNFSALRKWVAENCYDNNIIFRKLYDGCSEFMDAQSIPQLVLIIAQYQYQAAFTADLEINMAACLVDIMQQCTFK